MKKFLINYYAVIMMLLFILYNIVLVSLKIGGLLYQFFMIGLIVLNSIMIIKFRKDIKYKSLVIIVYFFVWLYSKNTLQCLFCFLSILTLVVSGFMESNFIKVIARLIIFVIVFHLLLLFIFLFTFGMGLDEEKGMNDIYEDMHYYCENNYEAYCYSAGAMDSFHYSIGKRYEFLNIDGIIYVVYSERNEKTEAEYEEFLNNHSCRLVGEENECKQDCKSY